MWDLLLITGAIVAVILACIGGEKVEETDKKTNIPNAPTSTVTGII